MKVKKLRPDNRCYKLEPSWCALSTDLSPDWCGKELQIKDRLEEKQKELRVWLTLCKFGDHQFTPSIRFSTKGQGWPVAFISVKTMDRIVKSWLEMRKKHG